MDVSETSHFFFMILIIFLALIIYTHKGKFYHLQLLLPAHCYLVINSIIFDAFVLVLGECVNSASADYLLVLGILKRNMVAPSLA